MLTRSEVRTLQEAFGPELLTAQSGSAITETVIIDRPIKLFAIGLTNVGATQTYRFLDGTNAIINRKIYTGTIATNGEFFLSFTPSFVRFSTSLRLVTSLAGSSQWTIFYQEA